MKITTWLIAGAALCLAATLPAPAATITLTASGAETLDDPLPELAYSEVVGGFSALDYNGLALGDRLLFTFDHADYASGQLHGVILRTPDAPVLLRNNFGNDGGSYRHEVGAHGAAYTTSGTQTMVYGGPANPNFTLVAEYFGTQAPVYGFGFTLNRFLPDGSSTPAQVTLYSDEAGTAQLGSPFSIQPNNGVGIGKSLFGYVGTDVIRHVKVNVSTGSQYGIDDVFMVLAPIPEPGSVALLGIGSVLLTLLRRRPRA